MSFLTTIKLKRNTTMTTMINPHANGRKRASLNEQINRLDSILDGLSEGLNEAVADAVKAAVGTAVKEAVQAVLKEVLANPTILAKLQGPTTPASEAIPALARTIAKTPNLGQRLADGWQQARAWVASIREACRQPLQNLRTSTRDLWQRSIAGLVALWAYREVARPFKYQILTALTIGLLIAVLVCYAGPWLAAIIGGIGGFVTTLAVQAGLWLRQLLKIDAEEVA
jgi:hypothetical protein